MEKDEYYLNSKGFDSVDTVYNPPAPKTAKNLVSLTMKSGDTKAFHYIASNCPNLTKLVICRISSMQTTPKTPTCPDSTRTRN